VNALGSIKIPQVISRRTRNENNLAKTIWTRVVSSLAIVFLALTGMTMASNDMQKNKHFDIFDEAAHFDYVLKLKTGEVPAWGSLYEQETMRIAECLGSAFAEPGDCSAKTRDPKNFAPAGYSYQAQQPPLGYLPFVFFEKKDTEPDQTLEQLRIQGSQFWLFTLATLIVIYSALMRLSWVPTILMGALILLNPIVVHSVATISNDSAVVVSVIAWMIIRVLISKFRYKIGKWSVVMAAIGGLLLVLTKGFLILIPFAELCVYASKKLIAGDLRNGKRSLDAILKSDASAAFFAGIIGFALFLSIQSARAIQPSSIVLDSLLGFSKTEVPNPQTYIASISNMLVLFKGTFFGTTLDLAISEILTCTVIVIMVLVVRAEITSFKSGSFTPLNSKGIFSPGLVAISTLFLMAICWPSLLYVQGNFDFAASSRYALIALPLIASSVVSIVNSKKQAKGGS
jgi:hypothetical protein